MKNLFKTLLIMTIVTTAMPVNAQKNNPLLQDWNTPHGTPPFSQIKIEYYEPAIKSAIKSAEKDVQRIIKQKDEPTFENTIVALEKSDVELDKILGVLMNLNECNTSDEMQKTVMKVLPAITKYSNSVSMNEDLFERVKKVYDKRAELNLTIEQSQLLEDCYMGFVRNGVNLNKEDKKQYSENSERLAELTQQFNQNVLADNNAYILNVTNEADLKGLPQSSIAAAKQEAIKRNKEGWVFTLAYPSYGPFMSFCENRDLRKQMWIAYNSRGNHGDKNDNIKVIQEITELRYKQAKLLGYETYSDYVLSDRMVETPNNLRKFMRDLLNACYPVAKKDLRMVQEYANQHGFEGKLQRWDMSYYTEQLKQSKYKFDAEQLRPYFALDKVRKGIFDLYGTLYGLRFVEANNIEVYHPDVTAYEVFDGDRFMGVLYLDMFPRESKGGGAWMTEFREQSNLYGTDVRPVIQVVTNFSKPIGDEPALLSFDEVNTFMHEMGHAMHGMLSELHYPSLSGTSVKRDFVELPSQIMENWCVEKEWLNTFARHYKTGELIPEEYLKKIKAVDTYMSGYYCLRQLSLGLVDFAFHTLTTPFDGNIEAFEKQNMVELLPQVKGCNTSTAFGHIFGGGYASGYYGYKWAEVLDADAFSKFKQNGIFDKKTAGEFRKEILSKGGSQHPAILYKNFMGREPDQNAFLVRSGFLLPIMNLK